MEPFTMLEYSPKRFHLFDEMLKCESGKTADHDLQYIDALRRQYSDKIVTAVPQVSANIVGYANAGNASIELDTETEDYASWKGYVLPEQRAQPAALGEATQFAKYHLKWKDTKFLLYLVQIGFSAAQYVVTDRKHGEDKFGPSSITDELIMAAGHWHHDDTEVVWVYDMYWRQDKALYQDVKKANWGKVILDEGMKKELTSVAGTFFNSKQVYEDLGVPWKRGLLFHGPPGNGKTVSIKALMHTLLFDVKGGSIPTLYVKAAPYTYNIGDVFRQARRLAPCMVVLEDVETIVTPQNRSYFFNEMDGLANNDGLFIVASTNYLDRLDPGLTKRPSRFDRKYLFPLPNEHERTLYCEYWRKKVDNNKNVDFPKKLCPAMSRITPGFSFAFLQECFVATFLSLARPDGDIEAMDGQGGDDDNLDDYEVWRAFKQQAEILRREIRDYDGSNSDAIGLATAPATGDAIQDVRRLGCADRMFRGFNKQTGAQTQLTDKPVPLHFNDRKQPELNTFVWSWVGPRGDIGN